MPNPFNTSCDLDQATPEAIPQVLRTAAQRFAEAQCELSAAWGDPQAGRIWARFAKIMERAAASCEREIAKGL